MKTIMPHLLRNPVVLDVETTIRQNGNPFNPFNQLVTIQLKCGNSPPIILTKENFTDAVAILDAASVVIGFNLKFDLHWIQRVLGWTATCVWDCQLAEFIFSRQTWKYPSLNGALDKYGFEKKLDKVAEYWEQGIDTTEIPLDILKEYGAEDVELTYKVFLEQIEQFDLSGNFKLFRVHCNDLLVLQEMEYNGILYDVSSSLAQAEALDEKVRQLDQSLYPFTNGCPVNWDSPAQKKVVLYGGVIKQEMRIPIGVYKTGAKIGQVRMKVHTIEHKFDRLVTPLKKGKEENLSVEEDVLLSLKPNKIAKMLITLLLERVKLMKLNSTYLRGFPKRIADNEWQNNYIYSALNQCLVVTGRLSSAKPNTQNLPKECKIFCISRYD